MNEGAEDTMWCGDVWKIDESYLSLIKLITWTALLTVVPLMIILRIIKP